MRDSLVDTSTMFSRDGSVVDHGDVTPTAIVSSGDAALAVRVDLARIIDGLTLEVGILQRNLVGDKLEDLLGVPLAISSVSALEENEDAGSLKTSHSLVEGSRSRSTNSTDGPGKDSYFRSLVDAADTLQDSLGGGDPKLVEQSNNLTSGPDGTRRSVDGTHGRSEGSIPFTLNVTQAHF